MVRSIVRCLTLVRLLLPIAALAPALAAHAANILKVGPHGDFATIQLGIDFALLSGGDNILEVETGTYDENISLTLSSGSIDIRGGWNSTFTQYTFVRTATVIFGGGTARVLDATINGGSLEFSNFTFEGGSVGGSGFVSIQGGGAYLKIAQTGSVDIENSNFSLNSVQATGSAYASGGGLYAELSGSSGPTLGDITAAGNGVSSENGNSAGAGMYINADNSSAVSLKNCVLETNFVAVTGTGWGLGGGAGFNILGSAQLGVDYTQFLSNTINVTGSGQHQGSGAFVSSTCSGSCNFVLTRATYDGNQAANTAQLDVEMDGSATQKTYVADVLVSRGEGDGMIFRMGMDAGNATNLTIADNVGTGIRLVAGPTLTLFNTIAWSNGTNLVIFAGSPMLGNNLIGVDPMFVDEANGNYHIRADSPARDAGTATPPGGLPASDLGGDFRTFGPAPDIGAYEVGNKIFANGFQ